jgi:hypothetical protein
MPWAWIFATGMVVTLAGAPANATVYAYSGNGFDTLEDTVLIPGAYTSPMAVSVSLTTDAPLAANLSTVDVSGLINDYEFKDGRQTLDPANSTLTTAIVSTNGTGSIISWSLSVHDPSPWVVSTMGVAISSDSNTNFIIDVGIICFEAVAAETCGLERDLALISGSPGSWVIDPMNAVPGLPVAGLIVLGGLLVATGQRALSMRDVDSIMGPIATRSPGSRRLRGSSVHIA